MEWLKNLSNAIEYIESHLDTEISYEEAARIACCSTYYFSGYFPMLQEFHCQNTSANAGCPKLLLNYKGQIKKFWMWHLNTVIHRQQHLTGHFNLFMELPLPLQKIKGLH